MLLNDFFKIKRIKKDKSNTGSATVRVEINRLHAVFDGHFPGNPIVPGVCQLQMIKEILSELEGKTYYLKKGIDIKHIGIIVPGEPPLLDFNLDYSAESDDSVSMNCTITAEDKTFLKFRGVFVEKLA
ncbi:MAG: 3-hydroxyacyl-ACP dehydratase [Bacteroidetes bacterium]|nr:3-hydroxyacyl-ACP dehydratase [Bacteroidota bacterium]